MNLIYRLLKKAGLVAAQNVPEGMGAAPTVRDLDEVELAPTEVVRLDDLLDRSSRKADRVASTRMGLGATPSQVFASVGLQPPEHGWTVERILAFLADPPYVEMPFDKQQKAIMAILAHQEVAAASIVEDVLVRDGMLDRFEDILVDKVKAKKVDLEIECEALEVKLRELQRELEARRAESVKLDADLLDWRRRKIAVEREWARGVAYLTADPKVSIGDEGALLGGDGDDDEAA